MTRRAARRVALALLVVSAFLIGATGQAAAAGTVDDAAQGAECTLRAVADLAPNAYIEQCATPQEVNNASRADLYANARSVGYQTDYLAASTENQMEATRSLTWCRARANTTESLQNGESLQTALEEKNRTVDKAFAGHQYNYVNTVKSALLQIHYVSKSARDQGIHVTGMESVGTASAVEDYSTRRNPLSTIETRSNWGGNVSLPTEINGNRYVNGTPYQGDVYLEGSSSYGTTEPFWGGYRYSAEWPKDYDSHGRIGVKNPANGQWRTVYNSTRIEHNYRELIETRDSMQGQTTQWTKEMYAQYGDDGDTGLTIEERKELSSACSLAQFSTDTTTTGSYAELRAGIGLLGFDSNANTSFSIAYTPRVNGSLDSSNTTLLEGGLMTNWKPASTNGSWESGATYDTANADSQVLYVAQTSNNTEVVNASGGSQLVALDGEIKIISLTNPDTGEEVESTTTRDHSVRTANATFTAEEVRDLLQYRRNVSENYRPPTPVEPVNASIGGGGIPWSLDGQQVPTFVVATVLIAIVLLNVLSKSRP
ncbi:hypothetical protein [Haloarcula sediminis]|uniref:hypothetical protein n=1 Tax=Haloarcula sediminis TaxID=3111777 RepID=UPI002D78C422|nr:hypothetical protein [Haloarcula sp. CK38]